MGIFEQAGRFDRELKKAADRIDNRVYGKTSVKSEEHEEEPDDEEDDDEIEED